MYRGWISWLPAVGETQSEKLERQKRMFEGEWREAILPDGKVYFFNTHTGRSRKGDDPPTPEEGLYGRRRFALAHHLQALADDGKIDQAMVNPGNLRSFAAEELPEHLLEEGVFDMSKVVLPGGGDAASRSRQLALGNEDGSTAG